MISIVKYISEMIGDDGEYKEHQDQLKKQLGEKGYRKMREERFGEKTGKKILKKVAPEEKPVPAPPPPEDHTIYTNPIRKFINAIKQ